MQLKFSKHQIIEVKEIMTGLMLWLVLILLTYNSYLCSSVCNGERNSTDVIVVLGQKKHSSYDASHSTSLEPILSSLETHYSFVKEADILIWHEGDLNESDISFVKYKNNIRFCRVDTSGGWGNRKNVPAEKLRMWHVGYLKMIRFYAVTIWSILDNLGYKWMIRFDDDSRLLSDIKYNIFDFMRTNNKSYGYRTISRECGSTGTFNKFVTEYINNKRLVGREVKNYCHEIGSLGYYNNFYITNISWWLSESVVSFTQAFDISNLIFTQRDNDLIFQTAAVNLFLESNKIMHFTDWSYLHHTIRFGKVLWGGMDISYNDKEASRKIHSYVSKFHMQHIVLCEFESEGQRAKLIFVTNDPTCPYCNGTSTELDLKNLSRTLDSIWYR